MRLFLPVYRNAAEVEGGDGGHVHVYRVPEVAHGRGEVPPVQNWVNKSHCRGEVPVPLRFLRF